MSKSTTATDLIEAQACLDEGQNITESASTLDSVRGFLSAVVRKKLKLPLVSEVGKDGVRRYHVASLKPDKASA